MKTLDEVIEALEDARVQVETGTGYWVDYRDNDKLKTDALHYLKEYRSDKAMWEADRKGYLDWIEQYKESREKHQQAVIEQYKEAREKHQQAVIELKKNPPLTWEEFCKMGDKAVWIEVHGAKALHTSGWALVGNTSFTTWAGVPSCSLVKVGVTYALPIDEYGKTWQAYRKEVDISLES